MRNYASKIYSTMSNGPLILSHFLKGLQVKILAVYVSYLYACQVQLNPSMSDPVTLAIFPCKY